MSFLLSLSGWIFPLRRESSSSLLILPGLLRSDRGGLSVSSPSGEREDACGLRRWRKFPASEFYSASFLHWISSLSYPYFTTLYSLNKRLIKQLFPDFRRRCPHFKFPGSTGAGPRQSDTTEQLNWTELKQHKEIGIQRKESNHKGTRGKFIKGKNSKRVSGNVPRFQQN